MATAREIIRLGYREANFKTSLGDPTDEEFAEGLTLLQGVVDSVMGTVVGTRLHPWYVPYPQRTGSRAANYPARPADQGPRTQDQPYPPVNVRLLVASAEDRTIYLQAHPEDGAVVEYVDVGHGGDITLDANGALFGLTGSNETVEILGTYPAGRNPPRRWIYRMDYGAWLEVTTLGLDSELPFPRAYDDFFVTFMAVRLAPRFGQEPRQATVARYREMEAFIKAQWVQTSPQVSQHLGIPTEQSWNPYDTTDLDGFNTGRGY